MKYKAIVVISLLVLLFNIGLAQFNQHTIDKKAMAPKKDNSRTLVATNNFYDLIVEDEVGYGLGTYTVRTGINHPATIAMGSKQNVLYGGAAGSPWTTYLSVKSYKTNTIYHTQDGSPTPDPGCVAYQLDYFWAACTTQSPTSILSSWNIIGEIDYLRIEQRTFIDGTTLDDSKIGVTTKVKNTGLDTTRIGIRYEWDIMIDGWDGSAMREKNPQGPWLYSETTWTGFNYTHYEITDSIPSPTFYNLGTVTGPTYLTPPPTPPDKVQFASWPYSYDYAFNYTTTGQYLYGIGGYQDSDIMYYWGDNPTNAIVLTPGDSVMVTQYLFASVLTINYQPDNHIKNSVETSYIGDNIYNLTGENQTKSQTVAPNNTAIYHVKIENDGTGSDGFIVNEIAFDANLSADATTNRQGWNVAYFDALIGGNNITSQVTGMGGWSTGALNPGQFREIRMEVTPDLTVPSGSSRYADLLSTSQNDNSKRDVVRAITTAGVYQDIGPIEIVVPADTILAGTVVTPRVVVKNFGNQIASPARVYISFGSYNNIWTGILEPGQTDTVVFSLPWNATAGFYNTVARTQLAGDNNPANDTLYGWFVVVAAGIHDVGVTAILAPIGTITAGTVVTPRAVVRNFGDFTETFDVTFTFFGYADTQTVTNLASGAIDTVEFDNWTAVAGSYLERSFTMLTGDQNRSNDTTYMEFSVTGQVINDVGVTQILSPIGSIASGTVITPKAVVHNFGNQNEVSVPVHFNFGSYSNTQTVNLLTGQTDTVEFNNWTAVTGSYNTMAYTALIGDANLFNDTAYGEFNVYTPEVHDVGATQILAPTGTINAGTVVTPTAVVHNFGNVVESSVLVYFTFGTYSSNRTVSLAIGQTDTIEFDNWTTVSGNYNTKSYTALVGDINLSNDTAYGEFSVYTPEIHDVGTTVILAPNGVISHGTLVIPRAKVKNFSPNMSETFYARFKIGDVYNQAVLVTNLARGEEREIEFSGWMGTGCIYVVSCSTELVTDQNTSNDKLTGLIDVLPIGREIQTNWVSGPGVSGPVPHFGQAFNNSDSINYNITGQISLIATGVAGISDAPWTKHIIESTTAINGHNGIFPADFDGDGDLDLAAGIDDLNVVRIYRNQKVETGTVNYVPQVSLSRTIFEDCLLWCGDLDKDGDADIVVPGPTVVGWYENTGNFNFTYHSISSIAHSSPCCDVGDIDNDGDNDIIVGDQPLDLYRNNGNMTFTRTNIAVGVWWRVKLGDLNNDNYLDLLNSDQVYINNNGNFPSTASWIAPLATTDGSWIRDFDNDGINDLLLADATTQAIYWYKNSGTGINYTQNIVCPGPNGQYYLRACVAEDMDLDGKNDVVGTFSRVGLFKQITPSSFQEIIVDSSFTSSHWCYAANLDYAPGGSDFDLDILATNGNSFAWWENPTAGLLFAGYGQLTSSVVEIPNAWNWKSINWYGNRPQYAALKLYVRSGATDSAVRANPWRGPFEVPTGQPAGSFNLTSHTQQGNHFFQYKVEMISNEVESPVVHEISVDYDTFTPPPYRDVGVAAVITPIDTIVTGYPFMPVFDIVNNRMPPQAELCTVAVNIWHYQVKMDSLCHISLDPMDSMLVYSASVIAFVEPGHNNVVMDSSWHPYWSDVYWMGGYHVIHASVSMDRDTNPDNDFLCNTFIVTARDHDLQTNWTGLLDGDLPLLEETLAIRTYNVASVVSNSPAGPTVSFRSKVRIFQENNNAIVYARYLDEQLAPQTYSCLSYQSGWTPNEPGWYRVYSWIETRPGVDMVAENNAREKHYYFTNLLPMTATGNTNQSTQGNSNSMPTAFGLMPARPNPFNNTTNINWQIPVNASVKLTVYDATGRIVKTLVNNSYPTGYYNATWNRTDDNNQKVAAGIYFYEMQANNYVSRQKIVIR